MASFSAISSPPLHSKPFERSPSVLLFFLLRQPVSPLTVGSTLLWLPLFFFVVTSDFPTVKTLSAAFDGGAAAAKALAERGDGAANKPRNPFDSPLFSPLFAPLSLFIQAPWLRVTLVAKPPLLFAAATTTTTTSEAGEDGVVAQRTGEKGRAASSFELALSPSSATPITTPTDLSPHGFARRQKTHTACTAAERARGYMAPYEAADGTMQQRRHQGSDGTSAAGRSESVSQRSSCGCGLKNLVWEALRQLGDADSSLGRRLGDVRGFLVVTASSPADSVLLLESTKCAATMAEKLKKRRAKKGRRKEDGRSLASRHDAAGDDGNNEKDNETDEERVHFGGSSGTEEEGRVERRSASPEAMEGASEKLEYWQLPGGHLDNADALAVMRSFEELQTGEAACHCTPNETNDDSSTNPKTGERYAMDHQTHQKLKLTNSKRDDVVTQHGAAAQRMDDGGCGEVMGGGGLWSSAGREGRSDEVSAGGWQRALEIALLMTARRGAARELLEETGIDIVAHSPTTSVSSPLPTLPPEAVLASGPHRNSCGLEVGGDGWSGERQHYALFPDLLFCLGKAKKGKALLPSTPPKYFFSLHLDHYHFSGHAAAASSSNPSSSRHPAESSSPPTSSSPATSSETSKVETPTVDGPTTKGFRRAIITLSKEHKNYRFVKDWALAARMAVLHSKGQSSEALWRLVASQKTEGRSQSLEESHNARSSGAA